MEKVKGLSKQIEINRGEGMAAKHMEKLLSGELTPDHWRDYIMENLKPTITPEEEAENRKYLSQWDHICEFEDITPTDEDKKDMELLVSGMLTHDEFMQYLKKKDGVI